MNSYAGKMSFKETTSWTSHMYFLSKKCLPTYLDIMYATYLYKLSVIDYKRQLRSSVKLINTLLPCTTALRSTLLPLSRISKKHYSLN